MEQKGDEFFEGYCCRERGACVVGVFSEDVNNCCGFDKRMIWDLDVVSLLVLV
jgi:hypothetical protein